MKNGRIHEDLDCLLLELFKFWEKAQHRETQIVLTLPNITLMPLIPSLIFPNRGFYTLIPEPNPNKVMGILKKYDLNCRGIYGNA